MQGFNSVPSTAFCGYYSEIIWYWPSFMCVHKGQSGWVFSLFKAVCLLFFFLHALYYSGVWPGVWLNGWSCRYILPVLQLPWGGSSTGQCSATNVTFFWGVNKSDLHLSAETNLSGLPALGENRTHHAEHLLPLVQAELVLAAHRSGLMCKNYNCIHLQNISPVVWCRHSETYWQRVKFGLKLSVKEPHPYINKPSIQCITSVKRFI